MFNLKKDGNLVRILYFRDEVPGEMNVLEFVIRFVTSAICWVAYGINHLIAALFTLLIVNYAEGNYPNVYLKGHSDDQRDVPPPRKFHGIKTFHWIAMGMIAYGLTHLLSLAMNPNFVNTYMLLPYLAIPLVSGYATAYGSSENFRKFMTNLSESASKIFPRFSIS